MTPVNRWMRLTACLGAIMAVAMVFAPLPALADGAPFPPYGYWGDIGMPGQKAILVYHEELAREDLILSVQLFGDSPEAAWVVPVPTVPEVHAASAEWFVQLSDLTQPEIVEDPYLFPLLMLGAAPGEQGVEMLSREQVGVYDVSILAADDPAALLDWLAENGYEFPETGLAILEEYVAEGWTFVATRVHPEEMAKLDLEVHPLWLSFATDRPVYPMRLTALVDNYMDVLIYALGDHRMKIPGSAFSTEFAGELQLKPVAGEGAGLERLLTSRAYYVTKLRRWRYTAEEIDGDLCLSRAATDETYNRTITHRVFDPIGACCPSCWPAAGLVVFVGLVRWRRPRSCRNGGQAG